MENVTAKPNLLKQVNLSQVRKVLAEKESATRAEIALRTGISSTTVRSLLVEMLANKEVESIGYDVSSGGRKAERYSLCPNRYLGVALCCMEQKVQAILVNLRGEITDISEFEAVGESYEEAIIPFLDAFAKEHELVTIGLGIPGIVEDGVYWKKKVGTDELYKVEIGNHLAKRYQRPVFLENDINAVAIGFGKCYEKSFPNEVSKDTNMVYLHLEEGCVSAGFLTGGQIIRGYRSFAGELGLIPVGEGKLLDSIMKGTMDDVSFIKWLVHILGFICGILNPQYIALGGPKIREKCIAEVSDRLFSLLPKNMFAELLYAPDIWHDYRGGLAHLTAKKIFEEISFVKE